MNPMQLDQPKAERVLSAVGMRMLHEAAISDRLKRDRGEFTAGELAALGGLIEAALDRRSTRFEKLMRDLMKMMEALMKAHPQLRSLLNAAVARKD